MGPAGPSSSLRQQVLALPCLLQPPLEPAAFLPLRVKAMVPWMPGVDAEIIYSLDLVVVLGPWLGHSISWWDRRQTKLGSGHLKMQLVYEEMFLEKQYHLFISKLVKEVRPGPAQNTDLDASLTLPRSWKQSLASDHFGIPGGEVLRKRKNSLGKAEVTISASKWG